MRVGWSGNGIGMDGAGDEITLGLDEKVIIESDCRVWADSACIGDKSSSKTLDYWLRSSRDLI